MEYIFSKAAQAALLKVFSTKDAYLLIWGKIKNNGSYSSKAAFQNTFFAILIVLTGEHMRWMYFY